MAPPPLGRLTEFAETYEGGVEKSRKSSDRYKAIAEEKGVELLDVGAVIETSDKDGVHFEEADHHTLGINGQPESQTTPALRGYSLCLKR